MINFEPEIIPDSLYSVAIYIPLFKIEQFISIGNTFSRTSIVSIVLPVISVIAAKPKYIHSKEQKENKRD